MSHQFRVQALKLLVGPVVFWLAYSLPIGDLPHGGSVALGTFVWAVSWWILTPIPWAATALLPLVIFPITETMTTSAAARLYGQPIFFWIMGTSLLGYAILKHGLAKRFALHFLSVPGISTSTYRLLFFYMLATGLVSCFVSDASTIAMMMPLGLSLQANVCSITGSSAPAPADTPRLALRGSQQPAGPSGLERQHTRLGTFFALGTLYAAVAGGIGTIAGAPHNAVTLAQYETITGRSIGFFSWMIIGVPIFLTALMAMYALLCWFYPPEIREIPGAAEFLREERRKLGRITWGEIGVLTVFLAAVAMFTLPPILPLVMGPGHLLAAYSSRVYSVWIVPPVILLLLFSIPVDLKKREFVLNWKEASAHTPWEILLMITAAVAMTDALEGFGFMKILTQMIQNAQIPVGLLPFFAGVVESVSTNFVSGVAAAALYSSILIPVAEQMGANSAAIAVVLAATSVGIVFPWAGATVATAFGFGEIGLKDLIRTGILAELILIAIAATYCLTLGSLL